MVVTGQNVVHVARRFCASLADLVDQRAAITVALQDASADAIPVGREATTPVRTGPLGHGEYRLTTWKRGLDDVCGGEEDPLADPRRLRRHKP